MKIILIFVLLFLLTVGNVLGKKSCNPMIVVIGRLAIAKKCNDYNPLRVSEAMGCTLKICSRQIRNYDVSADMKTGFDGGEKISCDGNDELYKYMITEYDKLEKMLIKMKCSFKHSK